MRIYLGNGDAVTIIDSPEGNSLLEVLSDVRDLWGSHSDQDAPDWVSAEDDTVANGISQQFAGAEVKTFDEGQAVYDAVVEGPPAEPSPPDEDVTPAPEAAEGADK